MDVNELVLACGRVHRRFMIIGGHRRAATMRQIFLRSSNGWRSLVHAATPTTPLQNTIEPAKRSMLGMVLQAVWRETAGRIILRIASWPAAILESGLPQ